MMVFGQYKGRLLADVVLDRNYVGWLLNQPWFGEKFPAHRHYLEATYSVDNGTKCSMNRGFDGQAVFRRTVTVL